MTFTGKFNAGMADMTKAMKNAADNYKLDGKIAEQKKLIKMVTREIADLVVLRLDAGDEMAPEIMERYNLIKEARAVIEELEKERKTTKVVCPNCGMKTSAEMNYCGKCGTRVKEDVEEASEEVASEEASAAEDVEPAAEETAEENKEEA